LNDAQNIGMSLTSVGGGDCADGNWLPIAGFCGPGSVRLAGLPLVLTAPCVGSSGFPKEAARAVIAAAAIAPAAVPLNILRLETVPIEKASRLAQRYLHSASRAR
jgi:hypothetical protein